MPQKAKKERVGLVQTKVFKLDRLSKTDIQSLESWLDSLRWVWNEGLRMLQEMDAYSVAYAEEVDGEKVWKRARRCPLPWQYKRIDRDQPWSEENSAPYTYMARKKPYAPFCPLQPSTSGKELVTVTEPTAIRWLKEAGLTPVNEISVNQVQRSPFLRELLRESAPVSDRHFDQWIADNPHLVVATFEITYQHPHLQDVHPRLESGSDFALSGAFAHKRHPDKPWLKAIPANFIRGVTVSLAKAWAKYKTGKGGLPRYKRRSDAADTLINEDAKTISVTQLNPRDGLIRIPRLGVFRVKHLWADWGDRPISVLKIAKRPDGWYLQLTGDGFFKPPAKETERELTLTAPTELSPLLGTTDAGKAVAAYAPNPKLLHLKERLQQRLARQQFMSNNWQKTKRKLAAIEKRMAEQAKNYNQKITTFQIRTYGVIRLVGVGDRKVIRKPKKNPRAKTFDPIHYDPNGAERIAEVNRQRTSQRVGQFVALIKQKAKQQGRQVEVAKLEAPKARKPRKSSTAAN